MKFTPDKSDLQTEVPFLDEARSEDGWQGQGTKVWILRRYIRKVEK